MELRISYGRPVSLSGGIVVSLSLHKMERGKELHTLPMSCISTRVAPEAVSRETREKQTSIPSLTLCLLPVSSVHPSQHGFST